jgi:transposase InsO family protein
LRQYLPKGTDLSRWRHDEIEAVAAALNTRRQKTLSWKTPADALNEHLHPVQQAGVATTGESGQFTAWTFTENLRRLGLLSSMGTVGDYYDNAPMESFSGSMQIELLNRKKWRTKMELSLAIAEYIEHFYNSDRRHNSLGHLTPNELEDLHSTTTQQATLS